MISKRDNYEIQAERARALFLKEDQEKLIRKFNLKADQDYIYVPFMDMTYLIDRKSGNIKNTVDNVNFREDNGYNTTLTIFDYLCLSRDDRKLSGRWVSMQEMGNMSHANLLEGKGDIYAKDAELFSAHRNELEMACEYLKGQRMPTGDVSYILKTFEDLPLYFQFWDGDEEFPPQLRFLWDTNTEQFVHYDAQFSIVRMVLGRLKEIMEGISD